MGITIHDVAKRAGVSHTTVSWVIHDDNRITPETKKKVWAAIKELNYHPNLSARNLVRGKTNSIAVVAATFSTLFELNIMKGIELGIDETTSDFTVNQYSTRGKTEGKNRILTTLLYGKRADAVICLNLKPDKLLFKDFKKESVPVVLIEEKMKGAHVIKTDNFKGAYLATEHLIQRGKKSVGLITGMIECEEPGLSPLERIEGYKAALEAYNIRYDPGKVTEVQYYYFEEGQESLRKLLSQNDELDSIFCAAGDMVAMGVLKEARNMNIRIPQDLAVIGYDDILTSSLVDPPLTTVRQPIIEMGRSAYSLAADAIEKKITEAKTICFEPKLVLRESV